MKNIPAANILINVWVIAVKLEGGKGDKLVNAGYLLSNMRTRAKVQVVV